MKPSGRLRLAAALFPLVVPACVAAPIDGVFWTVFNMQRNCPEEQPQCTFQFLLVESLAAAPVFCRFTIRSPSAATPPDRASFAQQKCDDPDVSRYAVSSNWDPSGFIAVTIENTDERLRAWFGYSDEALENGRDADPAREPVYPSDGFQRR